MPRSTYRLQINAGFTLWGAARLVDYLHLLGADWVYCSPLLAAEPGSDHGYDVIDHARTDPDRGGRDGLAALARTAHDAGMGVLVDIVPNHVGVATPRLSVWWWDVLRRGRESERAAAFDIDWDTGGGRVRVPVLADPAGDDPESELDALHLDGGMLRYYEHAFPVADGTGTGTPREVHDRQHYELVNFRRADSDLNYRRFFAVNTLAAIRVELPEVFADSHAEIAHWLRSGWVDGLRVDHPDGLADPGHYLRDLAGLTGSRWTVVEKILEPGEELPPGWACDGTTGYDTLASVDRLLVDPAGRDALDALDLRLRGAECRWEELTHQTKRAVADGILNSEIRRLARLVPAAGRGPAGSGGGRGPAGSGGGDLGQGREAPGEPGIPRAPALPGASGMPGTPRMPGASGMPGTPRTPGVPGMPGTPRLPGTPGIPPAPGEPGIPRAPEVPGASDASGARDPRGASSDGAPDPTVVDAIAELAACFPTYRSYLPEGADRLAEALTRARRRRPDLGPTLDRLVPLAQSPGSEFCVRLQQTTGAVMAKGVEDCAFYRYPRLASLTEVGGDPSRFSCSPAEFHHAQSHRLAHWPNGMTTLSTHDTKRGEDVRARIDVLAEVADEWADAVTRWLTRTAFPDRPLGHLLLQTAVGAWPIGRDRLHAYAEKAAREAGTSTGWIDPDVAFEQRLHALVDACFDDPVVAPGLDAFADRIRGFGWSNSLSAKLIQLTVPGVPDVYRGTELWENSLVDPDNRRPFDPLAPGGAAELLGWLDGGWLPPVDGSGAAKLLVTSRALRARRDHPDLFTGYRAIAASGPAADHVVAFDRRGAITLATRLPAGLAAGGGWGETLVPLPPGQWTDALTGRRIDSGLPASGSPRDPVTAGSGSSDDAVTVRVAGLLGRYPVALLLPTR